MAHPCLNWGFVQPHSTENPFNALPRHLLTTNDPPTDVEVLQIRDIVGHLHTRISHLDRSIHDLEDVLAKLRSRRKHAVEDIRRGNAVLSIIRRLPSDVLGEIFAYTVPDRVPRRRRATEKSPWVYGRVCRRWRSISVSLSTLW
ncbi:hypothetical protein K438DRAFT_1561373, partial [Mycena galopus ATCC 62051]